ncbi:transporter substrate-binding domain-containing protein [Vibrio sp. ZSDE26]|uniref:Transporter substrate-binding domain-containing protein n=1 Tax=Vibrio amylolyticus TaxID=2847292 RepID=A0A9X1XLJ5_9VIBR|nr:transporter substrate-binding domain-containing protein [Vibrio amylolyticus]MCK6264108.1 transporter substrate-binding domain-containing protein [Vibrio amylolyticus]
MGYRTNERPPLITKAPENQGLYPELYQRAAEKIDCNIEIIRAPKKRLLKSLREGEIDFYPGLNFTQERSQYIFYIENGLPGGDIGLSRPDFPTVEHLEQLKGYTLLKASGGPDYLEGVGGVLVNAEPEMSTNDAIELLNKNRGDFFIYNKASLEYHLKLSGNTSIKLHPNCCGGVTPLYLGFSRASKHFNDQPNPNYSNKYPISIDNTPSTLSPDSIAFKFQLALQEMVHNGETDKLYKKFYK